MKKTILKTTLFCLMLLANYSCSKSDSDGSNSSSNLYNWKGTFDYESAINDIAHTHTISTANPNWESQVPTDMLGHALFDNTPNNAQLYLSQTYSNGYLDISFFCDSGTFAVGTYTINTINYSAVHCVVDISPSPYLIYSVPTQAQDVVLKIDKISNTPLPFGQVTGSFSGSLNQFANSSVQHVTTFSGTFSAGINH